MKVSKAIKRVFQITGILLLLIIVAAIAIPYFFKDEIVARVKEDINKTIDAKVDFSDVDLSLLRSFPDFSFRMDDLDVRGKGDFEGVKLVGAESVDFSLNLMSVIKSDRPIQINSVDLIRPEINIIVLPNGKANYEITGPAEVPQEESTEEYSFQILLQEYNISNAQVVYDDRRGNTYVELKDLNHSGSGDFTETIFDLETQTNIASFTTRYDGITYLNKVKTDVAATFNCDLDKMRFELKENDIRLNALRLLAEGFTEMGWDGITMDMKFNAPLNEFKHLLSLIPNAYSADFADVKTSGKFQLNGFAKGTYNAAKNQYPAFKFNLGIENGAFQYPDLPLGMTDILSKIVINSPSSDFDDMTIDISQLALKLGNNPFDANLKLRTPISDPDIDTKIKGVINLEELAKAIPMEGVQQLNGIINADIEAHTQMSAIDKQDYEKVDMNGNLSIQNMNYSAEGLPPVNIKDMIMAFTPRNVKIDKFDAQIGKSDVQAKGTVDNILAYFSPEKTMEGNIEIRSNYFDVNEWMPTEDPNALPPAEDPNPTEVFDRFDFVYDAKVKKVVYDIYELEDISSSGQVTPSEMNIRSFATQIGNSDLRGNGKLLNWFDYVFKNEVLGGKMSIASNFFDLNQFMTTEELEGTPKAKNTAGEEELTPFVVPEGIDIDLDAKIGKLQYTNIKLKQLDGSLHIKDQAVEIKDASANAFGGRMDISGGYETRNPEKPKFNLEYDFKKMNFSEVFEKLNTFQAIAPIGKFIDGTFNTTLKMSGDLDKNLYPDMNSLSASGFLQTIDGVINNFAPLKKLSDKLQLKELASVKIKDTKNWFDVADGKVTLKDFDYKYKDIDMKIGGSHAFNQDMAYNIIARIPRKLLEQSSIGAAANKGLSFLSKEASNLGLNIAQGEFINLRVDLTGNIASPGIKIKPLGSDGEAVDSPVDAVVNQVKEAVTEKVDSVVTQTKQDVKEVKEAAVKEVKDGAKAAVDSILTDPTKITENPTEAVKDIGKKVEDKVGKDVKDKAGNLIDGIFGKKKKKKKKN